MVKISVSDKTRHGSKPVCRQTQFEFCVTCQIRSIRKLQLKIWLQLNFSMIRCLKVGDSDLLPVYIILIVLEKWLIIHDMLLILCVILNIECIQIVINACFNIYQWQFKCTRLHYYFVDTKFYNWSKLMTRCLIQHTLRWFKHEKNDVNFRYAFHSLFYIQTVFQIILVLANVCSIVR